MGRLLVPLLRYTERFLMMFHIGLGLGQLKHFQLQMVRRIEAHDEDGADRTVRAHLLELFCILAEGRLPPEGCYFLPALLSPASWPS